MSAPEDPRPVTAAEVEALERRLERCRPEMTVGFDSQLERAVSAGVARYGPQARPSRLCLRCAAFVAAGAGFLAVAALSL